MNNEQNVDTAAEDGPFERITKTQVDAALDVVERFGKEKGGIAEAVIFMGTGTIRSTFGIPDNYNGSTE